MPSFFTELRQLLSEPLGETQKSLAEALRDRVVEGDFTTIRRAPHHIRLILSGATDDEVARIFGRNRTTIRIARQKMSREIYDLYGGGIFNLIRSNLPENLRKASKLVKFNLGNNASSLISPYILNLVSSSDVPLKHVNVREHKPEVDFLVKHSIKSINQEMGSLSMEALKYLVALLDGDIGSRDDRVGFSSLIVEES